MKLFFTSEEQEVRKSNARADRKFLLEVAFFHWRKHKNFSPIGFLKKMEIANSPILINDMRHALRLLARMKDAFVCLWSFSPDKKEEALLW